jgi:hypothetical protein
MCNPNKHKRKCYKIDNCFFHLNYFLYLESKETKKEIQQDLDKTTKYGLAIRTKVAIEKIIQFTDKTVKKLNNK